MSIASTMISMGYLPMSRTENTCSGCAHASDGAQGLKCDRGGFYVTRVGGCREYKAAQQPSKVQVGPTDI